MAQNEEKYHGILQSTNGVMFMGTPHDGSDAAKLAYTLTNIASSITKLDTKQLKMLKPGSESLQEISRNFGFLDNLQIVTVIESNETRIPYLNGYVLVCGYPDLLYFELVSNKSRLYPRVLHVSISEIAKQFFLLRTLITTWFASFVARTISNTTMSGPPYKT